MLTERNVTEGEKMQTLCVCAVTAACGKASFQGFCAEQAPCGYRAEREICERYLRDG